MRPSVEESDKDLSTPSCDIRPTQSRLAVDAAWRAGACDLHKVCPARELWSAIEVAEMDSFRDTPRAGTPEGGP